VNVTIKIYGDNDVYSLTIML